MITYTQTLIYNLCLKRGVFIKAVIQRVLSARVEIDGKIFGEIQQGFMVLLGVVENDSDQEADFLAKKVSELRIFTDSNEKMNLSLLDIEGQLLVVSQFTLAADCSHGRRPSFINAARPEKAIPLYERFVSESQRLLKKEVKTGVFGADMQVYIQNDGPVTIILDTDIIMKH